MKRSESDVDLTAKKPKKRKTKVCNVKCEWENCQFSAFISPKDYHDVFSEHIRAHADDFICSLKMEAAGEGDDVPISCCCMWRECLWEGCEDLVDLIRHIMFHGYHALLKGLGKVVQEEMNIPPCQIEVDDPYVFSYVTLPYKCTWNNCNVEFICPSEFYHHVQDHISEDAKDVDTKLMRICCQWVSDGEFCKQDFRDKHKLKEHIHTHTHEKLLACPECGGLFSNRTKFLDHLSRQNEEAYAHFQCSHCLKRYASERLLRDHMRHHINYLKCPHCDMTCPNAGSLKYHIHYRHNNNRSFPCSVCELKFKSAIDLNRHEETHLAKNYLCNAPNCNFSCKTSRSLQSHMQIKHSKKAAKSYGCHICNSVYLRGFLLTKHLKRKHNYCWPSGHPRFRYIEHEDGLHRLQMVRFQSVELTERLQQGSGLYDYQNVDANDTNYNAKENIPSFDSVETEVEGFPADIKNV